MTTDPTARIAEITGRLRRHAASMRAKWPSIPDMAKDFDEAADLLIAQQAALASVKTVLRPWIDGAIRRGDPKHIPAVTFAEWDAAMTQIDAALTGGSADARETTHEKDREEQAAPVAHDGFYMGRAMREWDDALLERVAMQIAIESQQSWPFWTAELKTLRDHAIKLHEAASGGSADARETTK